MKHMLNERQLLLWKTPIAPSRKRQVDCNAVLRTTLDSKFGTSLLRESLWCEHGEGRSCIEPIVMRSVFRTDGCNSTDTANPGDLSNEFMNSFIHFGMTKAVRERVAKQCHQYYLLGRRHEVEDTLARQDVSSSSDNHSSNPTYQRGPRRILPPSSMNEVNQRYVVGKSSVTLTLPIPKVSGVRAPGHATTNPVVCVEDFLAHGCPFEVIKPFPSGQEFSWITESPRAQEILKLALDSTHPELGAPSGPRLLMVLPLLLWRDDFEANNSTKTRGSTWCFTMTIAPKRSHRNLLQQTYPLTLAKSCENHSESESYFLEKVQELMAGRHSFFSSEHGNIMQCVAIPYAFLCDQPERRKATRTLYGNGTFHTRFRFSIHHRDLIHVLRTCSACLTSMRAGVLRRNCETCCNWDPEPALRSNGPVAILEKLKLPVPSDFPHSHFGTGECLRSFYLTADTRILPFAMTSQRLQQSQTLAYSNMSQGSWTEKQMKAFLKRECFSTEQAETIIRHANNTRLLRLIETGNSKQDEHLQDLFREEAISAPHLYAMPPFPFSWCIHSKEDSLSLFVDVPMHLLFLGVVKSTLGSINIWLKQQRMFSDFKTKAAILDGLMSEVRLDWLPVLAYRAGGFGGWVSENYLAFSRIMAWFFQHTPLLRALLETSEPPSARPSAAWKKPHYVHWLEKRNQTFLRGATIKTLSLQIMQLLDREEGPPPVLATVAGLYTPSQVEHVLVSLEGMLHQVMTPTVTPKVTAARIELSVKKFLTEFDLLDQQVRSKDMDPKIVKSYNFLCLLNLPQITERFGPVRNLWEGAYKGEGYIRHCKQWLRGGQRKNFAFNSMSNCLRAGAYLRAMEKLENRQVGRQPQARDSSWSGFLAKSSGSYKLYAKRAIVAGGLSNRKVISILQVTPKGREGARAAVSRRFFVTRSKGLMGEFERCMAIYEIDFTRTDPSISRMGAQYFSWKIGDDGPHPLSWLEQNLTLVGHTPTFGVLLPLLDAAKPIRHTLVTYSRYSN